MASKYPKPVDWAELGHPEIAEFLERDRPFLKTTEEFFKASSAGEDMLVEELFETARQNLQDRDGIDYVEDEVVSEELGRAYLFIMNEPDPEYEKDISENLL